jgi:hypothetical protein
MAYWKAAGMSYLQYVNLATTALRNTVKPSLAARYAIKEDVHYKKQAWINSKPQEKRQQTYATRSTVPGEARPKGDWHMKRSCADLPLFCCACALCCSASLVSAACAFFCVVLSVYFTGSQTVPVRAYENATGHLAGADAMPAKVAQAK